VLADQHVIVNAPVQEVLAFDHPFIRHFFLGERGLRAMELLNTRRDQAATVSPLPTGAPAPQKGH
jgi:phospholipid/cholesterol/gamma-HCH transport system ATP-binding protein